MNCTFVIHRIAAKKAFCKHLLINIKGNLQKICNDFMFFIAQTKKLFCIKLNIALSCTERSLCSLIESSQQQLTSFYYLIYPFSTQRIS